MLIKLFSKGKQEDGNLLMSSTASNINGIIHLLFFRVCVCVCVCVCALI